MPTEANTVVDAGDNRIYWLGSDERLIVTPPEQQTGLKLKLEKALGGVFSSVVDNSSGLTMLHVTGERAGELLATDCPFDLHPRVFRPGQCAQTRLAKADPTPTPAFFGMLSSANAVAGAITRKPHSKALTIARRGFLSRVRDVRVSMTSPMA